MKNKRKLIKIFSLIVVIAVAVWANGGWRFSLNDTAYAVGDLTVNWGVPEGDPIFVVNNMAPGQSQNRNVVVTNGGLVPRAVAVKGIETTGGSLENVLQIVISQSGTDLFGGTTGTKTLQNFFTDSTGVNGIFLSNLNPAQSATYNFNVTFPTTAGNEYQNTSVVFDIQIGISVEVPAECSGITFAGEPIFGTSRGDRITGTPGNDLIFGFEAGDSITGNGGDDCILGGEGGDSINGNAGNDIILGQGAGDSLNGNNGNDRLLGGEGSDSLVGESGLDILEGGNGSDGLNGGNDADILKGEAGSDGLNGGNGSDDLDGGPGSDSLNGGANSDTCINGEVYISCNP